MSKFLSEVKGFTPVIDVLAQELGLMCAVVYGVVWRYCQMENRVCTASLEKIAKRASISRSTAKRHIKELCKAGYLKDLTPDVRNHPHTYADAGKVKIKELLAVETGGSERPTKGVGGSERPTSSQEEVGQRDPIGGSEKPMKIPIKRPLKDEERRFDSNFPSSNFSTETEEDDDFSGEAIAITIDKLSRKFGDMDHLSANITRAHNLWDRTGMYEEDFVERMEEAARATLQAVSKSQVRDRDKRMAYFFAVLEDKLGLRDGR
jgi:DNA-binding MarR family transcriptional regulator